MNKHHIPPAIANTLTSLKTNADVLFFSFLVFCTEFSLFKLLQYTTDYLSALTVISYALVGLGLGSWLTNWITTKGIHFFLNILSAFWLFFAVAVWKILRAPSSGPDSLLISLAFIPEGIYLARAFSTRMAHEVYWADLVGAALATVVTFLSIPFLSTEGFMSFLLLTVSALGLIACIRDKQTTKWKTALFLTLLCVSTVLLYGTQNILKWSPFYLAQKIPKKNLYKAFNRLPTYKLIKKYDNLISRIEVIQSPDPKNKDIYRVSFDGIDNDGFDATLPAVTLKDARFVWGLVENPRIFIVGASAQGIIKTARNITTAGRVSGVEINPAIYEAMTKDFAELANFPYQNTDIKVDNALHYLKNSHETYDIITLINIHSTARISIPGPPDTMQMIESYQTYLQHLSDQGYLMIEERPDTKTSDNAIHRQIITIYEALKQVGATDPSEHFFIYSWRYGKDNKFKPYTYNSNTGMLIKKTPLTMADRKAILNWYSIRIKLLSSQKIPTPEEVISFEKKSKFRLDYLKYFYETARYHNLFNAIAQKTLSQTYPDWDLRVVDRDKPYLPYIHKDGLAVFARFGGALLAIVFCIASVFIILLIQRKNSSTAFHGSYQILIGAGYLILEILFLQLYQENFRSPATAFVVILTTLLITSATGGYVISRKLTPSLALLGTFITLIIHSGLRAGGFDAISSQALRILAIILAVGISGFFMGYFLPFGLNMARTSGHTDKHLTSLFALNSLAGAVTPMLVLFLSSRISLSFSLWTAAILYATASIMTNSFNDNKKNSMASSFDNYLNILILSFSVFAITASYNSSGGSFFYRKNKTIQLKKETPHQEIPIKAIPVQTQPSEDKPARLIKESLINHPKSILMSPDGKKAYIQNLYAHTVSVVDTNSLQIIKTIPLKGRAAEADITPDGRWLWISVAALEDNKGTYPKYIPEPNPGWETYNFPSIVNLIDTTQNNGTVVTEIPVDVKPKILRLSPDGKLLLVSNFNSGIVSVINTKSRSVIRTIKVGKWPRGICFTSDGKYAYIANMGSREITVINMTRLKVMHSLATHAIPRHLVTSPDGRFIYFSDASRQGHLFKIDALTETEIGQAKTGSISRTFVLTSDGKKAFVGNYNSSDVTIVDTTSMTPIGRIKTLPRPIGLALSPDDKELWVSSFTKNSISIYNVNEL